MTILITGASGRIGSGPKSNFPFSRDRYWSERYLAETCLPFIVLRSAFYIDMFLEMFDTDGVVRGPAGQGRAAFVSREDLTQVAAETIAAPPGGVTTGAAMNRRPKTVTGTFRQRPRYAAQSPSDCHLTTEPRSSVRYHQGLLHAPRQSFPQHVC